MTPEKRNPRVGGRKPKPDPCRNRYSFNLNDTDNARFLSLFDASGLKNKSHFISACVFNERLKVIKIDKAAMDYYMRLTTFHSQFRAIGVNYNQTTKAIKTAFTDKKAWLFSINWKKQR